MITTAAVLMLVAGIWSGVVWPPFLRRVIRDPRSRDESGRATKFLTVHIVLVSVSLVLALALVLMGVALLVGER
ncbi:SCO4848 family membrane protein [Herbiconiux sp. L3-i23]|uniref:SCO4848 family membrane protein n=1 Tax=Herbiconiux sp. L3-i23 TaxID=2905871 RepID=UPI002045972C|nr:hypothetical protein L3i23_20280 [Herbiconiux sp. L3-i23]